jgi:hypothetical protein
MVMIAVAKISGEDIPSGIAEWLTYDLNLSFKKALILGFMGTLY